MKILNICNQPDYYLGFFLIVVIGCLAIIIVENLMDSVLDLVWLRFYMYTS